MNWQEKIEQILGAIPANILRKARAELSSSYREKNSSQSVFADQAKRLAYLATRFPATFAAVQEVCKRLPTPQTILDLGAGPATATLALVDLFPNIQATLVEKSSEAISLGKELLEGHTWICKDMKELKEIPKADLCILSYSLGEIKPLGTFLERLWQSEVATIAIIEPGTPSGYQTILDARDFFITVNAKIVAPCPHALQCPLKGNDWCHFSIRLERTKLHRLLKEGTLGYEDEKFSYLIVSKKISPTGGDRILRHPFKGSGFVRFNLCTEEGTNRERVVSRKDKELYRLARDAKWGDLL
ncbi:MAG TPA: small ribosomal subunit Rsm22 family protein [Chlamydiales bacterium]|nr:small ribosomal subunit Rsm22 family protein [Chlamydiales bacterium]